MENVYKLFDIWEQILKVQKLYENENKECYKLVLEDFDQKKEDILSYFEKNYAVLQSVAEKIEKNAGFDFDDFLLANIITHQNLSCDVLLAFSSLQTVWEFFECQAFSALNFKEALSVRNISYFKEYIEAFLGFKNWEYQVSQTYLNMTLNLKELFSSFVKANAYQEISVFADSEKAFEMEIDVLKKLYKKLVRYDIKKEEHGELLLLFESCLKNFPKSCLSDVWNELQAYFFSLDLADVYEKYFYEANGILLKYKVGLLEYEGEQDDVVQEFDLNSFEYYQNGFLMDVKYSYTDILSYHKVFLELEELSVRILHVYEKIMACKMKNEHENKTFYQNFLKSLLEQEKAIYQTVDLIEFQNYLRIVYAPDVNYFPFTFLDLLPNGDVNKEKEFALHRMVNYQINRDDVLSSLSLSTNGIIQVLDEEEIELPDAGQFQKLLFSLTSFVLDKISKDEFVQELGKIVNFEEQYEFLKEEQIASLWQYIEKKFLNILLENGEQVLVWYYMFFKNKEMEYLLQNDFRCTFEMDYSPNATFYSVLRKFLIKDLQNSKKEISNSDDVRKKKLFSYYLESCLTFFKDKDKEKFQKIREIVRKK